MNIKNFSPGDIIVRVEPAKKKEDVYNDNLGTSVCVETVFDRSYTGEPFKLLDTANGMVYLEKIGRSIISMPKRELPLDVWSDGWEYFVVPNGYTMEDFINAKTL